MPRGGPPTNTYSLPAIYLAIPGTLITAAQHNTPLEDIASTLNAVWPINLGGTGGTSKQTAIDSLFDGVTYIVDEVLRIAAVGDPTKILDFDLAGLTASRTLTAPDRNGEISTSGGTILAPTATTSGSSVIVASSLPSWLSQITLNFNAVSTNGNARVKIQLGTSGGIVSSGYIAGSAQVAASTAIEEYTDGFGIRIFSASTASVYGSVTLTKQSVAQDVWIASGVLYDSDSGGGMCIVSGIIILAAALTQIQVTTGDAFDQGSINAVYG